LAGTGVIFWFFNQPLWAIRGGVSQDESPMAIGFLEIAKDVDN
jgi:hypothetical protein